MTVPNTVVLIGFVTVAAGLHAAPIALTALKPHKVKVEQTTCKGLTERGATVEEPLRNGGRINHAP
jgi:hypothetical protein